MIYEYKSQKYLGLMCGVFKDDKKRNDFKLIISCPIDEVVYDDFKLVDFGKWLYACIETCRKLFPNEKFHFFIATDEKEFLRHLIEHEKSNPHDIQLDRKGRPIFLEEN